MQSRASAVKRNVKMGRGGSLVGQALVLLGDGAGDGIDCAAALLGAARGELGHGLAQRLRGLGHGCFQVVAFDGAHQQGRGPHAQDVRDMRDLLKGRRALAALQTAKVKKGYAQTLGGLLLRQACGIAGRADIAPDGGIGNLHQHSSSRDGFDS